MGYSSPHLSEIIHYNLDQDYSPSFDLNKDQNTSSLTQADLSRYTQTIIPNWLELHFTKIIKVFGSKLKHT